MLLQVVADAGDVAGTFDGVRQTNTGNLTKSGVRLLGRHRLDAQANAALLRAALKNGRGRLVRRLLAALANQLIDRGHESTSKFMSKSSATLGNCLANGIE